MRLFTIKYKQKEGEIMEKEINIKNINEESEEVLEVEGYKCSSAARRCAYDCLGTALWSADN